MAMAMRLTSAAFAPSGEIPARFTCDGRNLSLPLAWSNPPPAVRSFAIICRDPDAPSRTFYHWAAFDIPPSTNQLPENWAAHPTGSQQAVNDFGKTGYGGPCPPHGHGTHHYHLKLYALDVEHLDVPTNASCRDVERAIAHHAVATAELIGTYAR